MSNVIEIAKNAKFAAIESLQLSDETKNSALNKIADALEINREFIISANKTDLENASLLIRENKLSTSLFNRLKLDENKLRDMIQGVKDIANLENPVNKELVEDVGLTGFPTVYIMDPKFDNRILINNAIYHNTPKFQKELDRYLRIRELLLKASK